MKEYLIEISLEKQQEMDSVIMALLKYRFKLDKAFTPKN